MIYVEQIKVVGKTYPSSKILKKNFKIKCSSINLFVGNQGCGKSTMLNLLQQSHKDLEITLSDYVKKHGVNTFYFNTETDNPRVKDPQLFTDIQGRDKGIGYVGAVLSRFRSHGEVLQDFIFEPLAKYEDCVIFIDEPESGLSITNQFKLIDAIKNAVNNNCQLFIATHCYPLIEQFDVISLEHNKQMKGKDFIHKVKSTVL